MSYWTTTIIEQAIKQTHEREQDARNKRNSNSVPKKKTQDFCVEAVQQSKDNATTMVLTVDMRTWFALSRMNTITHEEKKEKPKILKVIRHLHWTSDERFIKVWLSNFPIQVKDQSEPNKNALKLYLDHDLLKDLQGRGVLMVAIARNKEMNFSKGFGFAWMTNAEDLKKLEAEPPVIKGMKKIGTQKVPHDFQLEVKLPTKLKNSWKGKYDLTRRVNDIHTMGHTTYQGND